MATTESGFCAPQRAVDDLVAERVLRAVEQIPEGQMASYGDLAALVGAGPRQVGAILRVYGSNVAWWRVTNASGELPAHLHTQMLALWAAEGIALKANGRGCRIAEHRVNLAALAAAYDLAVRGLAEPPA